MFKKKIKTEIDKKNAEKLASAEDRIKKALSIAWSYGQSKSVLNKTWTIDQMVRSLCENEEEYRDWVYLYESPIGGNGYYKWHTGIAP